LGNYGNRYASLIEIIHDDREIMIRPQRITTSGDRNMKPAAAVILIVVTSLLAVAPRWGRAIQTRDPKYREHRSPH